MNDFDFKTAKPVSQVPALQRLRQAYQESTQSDDLMNLFDSDVQEIIKQHNTPQQDRKHLNAVIRALYMTA